VKAALNRFICKLEQIFLHENWMVGIIDQPIENSLTWKACPPIQWLGPRSKTRYLADPFPWPEKQNVFLCESFNFEQQKGAIKRIEVKNGKTVSESEERIPLPGHISFPFVFVNEGHIYILPETSASRAIVLLRWVREKKEWSAFSTVLEDVAAADSILFNREGLFWIAYTDVDRGRVHDNLNLLYASSLEGPWKKHEKNPVVQGLEISRCGGTPFSIENKLYRPAQDCSERYGKSLRIMEVVECTPSAYKEREVAIIPPNDANNPDGIHTLSAWGNKCLVDGKRMMFSPKQVLIKIRRRLAKIRAWIFLSNK